MIETIELTPAVVGLGNLHEAGLLALLADTHYRILTSGGDATPREISNKAGELLYPSIFALHLRVPPQRLIESHTLWQKFDLGVDVRTFGRQFLDVNGVIGNVGEVPDALEAWTDLALPRVSWSGAWTVTRSGGEHELSMPNAHLPADAPRLTKVPAAIMAAREAHLRGAISSAPAPNTVPVRYPVLAGRDAAIGRQMMFSQFVVVMNAAEHAFLADHIFPAFPDDLLACLSTIERKIFYFGNCGAGDVIEVHVTAKLERLAPAGPEASVLPSVTVHSSMELVDARTRRLLALAETRRLLATSPTQAGVVQTIERLFSRHGEGTPMRVVQR